MSGPCVDAWAGGEPVLKPDLAAPILVRWPAFAVAGGRPGCYALEVLQELPQRWPLRGEDRSIVVGELLRGGSSSRVSGAGGR